MYNRFLGYLSADLGGRVGWLPKAERVKGLKTLGCYHNPQPWGALDGLRRRSFTVA